MFMFKKMGDYEALGCIDIKVGEYFELARKNNIKFAPFSITASEMLEKMGPTIRSNCLLNYRYHSLKRSVDIALCDIKNNEIHLEVSRTQTTSERMSLKLILSSLVRS